MEIRGTNNYANIFSIKMCANIFKDFIKYYIYGEV